MKRFASYYLPALVYAAVIFVVSSIPRLPTPDWGFDYADKIAHFIEYLGLGFLVRRAFGGLNRSRSQARIYAWSGFACMAFAALDEFHQGFVPGRTADVTDFLADLVGVAVGMVLYRLVARRRKVVLGGGHHD